MPGAPKKKRRRRKKKKPAEGAAPASREGEHGPRSKPHRASDRAPFHVGEEVFGKVTAVLDTAVMIDLSGKALAIFDRSEMEADDLGAIDRRSVRRARAQRWHPRWLGGAVTQAAARRRVKPKVEQAHKDGTLVSGLVTGVIKGGIRRPLRLRAFAPASGWIYTRRKRISRRWSASA